MEKFKEQVILAHCSRMTGHTRTYKTLGHGGVIFKAKSREDWRGNIRRIVLLRLQMRVASRNPEWSFTVGITDATQQTSGMRARAYGPDEMSNPAMTY